MTRFQIILIGVALAGGTASLVIQHDAQIKVRKNEAALRREDHQLSELTAEQRRLSDRLAQAKSSTADDRGAELAKLRAEAEALRKQTNELGKELAENRHPGPWRAASRLPPRTRFIGGVAVVSDSNSEDYHKQLHTMADSKMADVRNLSSAVNKYAREHQGEYPTSLDRVAPYFYEFQARINKMYEQLGKLSGSTSAISIAELRSASVGGSDVASRPVEKEFALNSQFEIVYQGSYNELTNVPLQAVALIRERQPWPTPGGKWARIYIMAGEIEIVESDDNFQSWEAAHIIPPQTAGQ